MLYIIISILSVSVAVGGVAASGGGGGGGGGGAANSGGSTSPSYTLPSAPASNTGWNSSSNNALINNYKTTEYNNQWGLAKINAAESYALLDQNGKAIGGDNLKISVIDSGVRTTHQDISANYLSSGSYNYIDGNSTITDGNGHGTHVASIAAGAKNNLGIQGVAFNSQIVAMRVLNNSGGGTDTNVALGINDSVSTGAKVINLSLGGSSSTVIFNALVNAKNNNVLSAIAVGNDGNSVAPEYPALYAANSNLMGSIIAVGAIDSSSNIASFSNKCGAAKDFCLVAPGVSITAAYNTANNAYAQMSGTSMATPHVAGAAAVIRAAWPALTAAQTTQILLQTATDLGASGTDELYGRGLLNLGVAVQAYGQNNLVWGSSVNGAGYDTRSSSIITSSAFGDAYKNNIAPILQNAVFFDDFGRDYKADLHQKISPSSANNYSVSNFLFNNYQSRELPFSINKNDNFKLKFSSRNLNEDLFDRENKDPKTGLKYLTYDRSREDGNKIAGQNISFSYSKNLRDDLKIGFATNSLDNDFKDNLTDKFGFITARSAYSPYGSISDAANFARNDALNNNQFFLSKNLNQNWGVHFSYLNQGRNYFLTNNAQNKIIETGLNYALGNDLKIEFSQGMLKEFNNGFLGSQSSGAFSSGSNSGTNYFSFSTTKKIIGDLYFVSNISEGKTNISGNSQGIFRDFNNVKSKGVATGLFSENIFNGKLGIVYSEPLRVYKGTTSINIPIARDLDGNVKRLTADNVSLKPSGKEQDLELFYEFHLRNGGNLSFNFLLQKEPGNIKEADNQYLWFGKYSLRF